MGLGDVPKLDAWGSGDAFQEDSDRRGHLHIATEATGEATHGGGWANLELKVAGIRFTVKFFWLGGGAGRSYDE